jgi:hypothetical protein
MKLLRVKVEVDGDVISHYKIREPSLIEFYVITYLNDPNGWAKEGFFFEPVRNREDVLIRLSSSSKIDNICGIKGNLSCAELGGRFVYLNADRWFHGSKDSKLALQDYRQYMVSHEIGHILGHGHKKCPCKGCDAPIMMQQTLGIGECKPNTRVR